MIGRTDGGRSAVGPLRALSGDAFAGRAVIVGMKGKSKMPKPVKPAKGGKTKGC